MVLVTLHIHRLLVQALGNQRKETRRHWHHFFVTGKEGPLSPVYKWYIQINAMDD
jgi:hypothetical protein